MLSRFLIKYYAHMCVIFIISFQHRPLLYISVIYEELHLETRESDVVISVNDETTEQNCSNLRGFTTLYVPLCVTPPDCVAPIFKIQPVLEGRKFRNVWLFNAPSKQPARNNSLLVRECARDRRTPGKISRYYHTWRLLVHDESSRQQCAATFHTERYLKICAYR